LLRYVGEDDLAMVRTFKDWLSAHKHKEQILFYLNQD
jgi:hypothetical protein